MEQMELWELSKTSKPVVNPIWEQLDHVVKTDVTISLSRLMTKALSSNHNETQSEQENKHD